jgi:hypothetical protein
LYLKGGKENGNNIFYNAANVTKEQKPNEGISL